MYIGLFYCSFSTFSLKMPISCAIATFLIAHFHLKCLHEKSHPPRVELGAPKIAIFWNIIMFENGEVDSLWCWMLPKIRLISKNASNKSCWVLNSVQKSLWAHMSISPRVELGALKITIFWNIIMLKNRGSRFTLRPDSAKNTHYIQKCFK